MESIIRNVKDIEPDKRHWLEGAIGKQLQDNQQVIIRVVSLGMEPSEEARDQAMDDASRTAARGRVHAASQGVDDAEVNAAIEEAIEHSRRKAKE